MLFSSGDKYIRFTKYGSIQIGTILEVGHSTTLDLNNGVTYYQEWIKTPKGIILMLDGSDGKIYKINKELSPEEIERYREFYKLSKQEKIRHIINKKKQDV